MYHRHSSAAAVERMLGQSPCFVWNNFVIFEFFPRPVPSSDKNWCADIGGDQGLYGATDDFEACCPEDCGKCGGDGCGDGKPGGRCCITQIYNRGRLLCTDEGATLPCIISTSECPYGQGIINTAHGSMKRNNVNMNRVGPTTCDAFSWCVSVVIYTIFPACLTARL